MAKELYSQHLYCTIVFPTLNASKDQFVLPGYRTLQQLEKLLVNTARGEEYKVVLAFVVDRYGDDFTPSRLIVQLEILTSAFTPSTEKPTLSSL